jgi:hypothetical protein
MIYALAPPAELLRMALAEYDVFLSHAWADGDRPQQIAAALAKAGLRVWFDAAEINDFASITHAVVEGLAKSKALLAYYSKAYPLRRACQWELTTAFLASQSEGDPRRRVLVVSPEKTSEHIQPIELRDAKFRKAPVDDKELQLLVGSIAKHVAAIDGPLPAIHSLPVPNWHGVSPIGSTRFVGRLQEMWEIHSLLHAGDVAQITGAAAATGGIGQVQGLGGVGKSLLAEEYALHFGAAYPGGIFWLRAYGNDDAKAVLPPEQREALRTDQMRQIAERLDIDANGMTADQVEGALTRKIASAGKPCLWVVDDVPNGLDGAALRRWFAPHSLARTLVTTRSREYGAIAKGINLSVLAPDEAHQLLTSRRVPASDAENEQSHELAKDLGYHALALDLTGSALLSSAAAEPFRDFRTKLLRPDKDAMTLAEALADTLPNGHEKSIALTMLRSIRGLGPEGLDFLRVASLLAVAPIPTTIVTTVFELADRLGHEDAEARASLALKQVTAASLAEIDGENAGARTVHTLVSRTVRFQQKRSTKRINALRKAVVEAIRVKIAQAAKDARIRGESDMLATHARHLVGSVRDLNEASLQGRLARYDFERGAYVSARALFARDLEFRTQSQGKDHPDTLATHLNLASTLKAQGDLAGARQHQERVLGTRRRLLGEDHPDTLQARNNLAATMVDQGDLTGARELQERIVAADVGLLALDPRVFSARLNLANTLRAQGDLTGARQAQEQLLAEVQGLLDDDDPQVLTARNNLAATLWQQGHYAGARQQQEQVLAAHQRMLGEDHPKTLTARNNLTQTLQRLGDIAGARQNQEQVLTTTRRLLGSEHPRTSVSAWNLIMILQESRDYAGVREVLERDLLWLLARDPATLSADQRKVREVTDQLVRQHRPAEEKISLWRRIFG